MNTGYIKLWRKFKDTGFFHNSKAVHIAIYLLIECNHQPRVIKYNGKKITVKRGQCVTDVPRVSEDTGISTQSIRTIFNTLAKEKFLINSSTNHFRLVSIVRYSDYQGKPNDEQQAESEKLTGKLTGNLTTGNTDKLTGKLTGRIEKTNRPINKRRRKRREEGEGRGTRVYNYIREEPPPRPRSASHKSSPELPEADILTVAKAYCKHKAIKLGNAVALRTYVRQRTMFYPAKDLLLLNEGKVDRALLCLADFAEHYKQQDKADWKWSYVLEDFHQWNDKRTEYEKENVE